MITGKVAPLADAHQTPSMKFAPRNKSALTIVNDISLSIHHIDKARVALRMKRLNNRPSNRISVC
ncbi:hypothetical protein D3C87_1801170 [compost metagenome]